MIKRIGLILLTLLAVKNINAQVIPVIIQGGTIHMGNGQIINNGFVAFDSGKIVFVDSVMRTSYKNARIIDAKGKHVYPGLILLNTILGLNEIDAVRATRDYDETGEVNPNVRTIIAYNTDSKLTPTALFNGVLYMQVIPQGGLVSGKSCVVKTQAMNWEDAALKQEDGIHINWPEISRFANISEQESRMSVQLSKLNQLIKEAQQYQFQPPTMPVNLKLQAMRPVLEGKQNLYIHVASAKGILEALQFAKVHGLPKIVLVTNESAAMVAEEIKVANASVIINNVHSLPLNGHSAIDQPFKAVAQLMDKGVLVAIGQSGSWESRNVMFNAGTCAAYGISKEQALTLLTLNAATILGLDAAIGTLEPSKQASLIVVEGDVLDMKTSQIKQAFINGEEVEIENTQTELYKKYSKRYGLEAK
ncbi:MAG: amidohydrolase [Bacteroidetes bacterium]|nr:MAG: amidohydrolase [Bacteroidota bacterium]